MERPIKGNTQDQITEYWKENDPNMLYFNTPERAKAKADEINEKYGDIAFVTKDRRKFTIKFRMDHIGEGFTEYKTENKDKESGLGKVA